MTGLSGKVALVTGASQGIGKAISKRLLQAGAEVLIVGRSMDRLQEAERGSASIGSRARAYVADLADADSVRELADRIETKEAAVHILVNCGGTYHSGAWTGSNVDSFRSALETNVVGPYELIRRMLPMLRASRGDIVFINSSIVRGNGKEAGQYAACKHALRSFADSLRAEENENGIRVMSVFPGRTATPLQREIYAERSEPYEPHLLLQPEDVAEIVIASLLLADTAEVTDVHVRQRHAGQLDPRLR